MTLYRYIPVIKTTNTHQTCTNGKWNNFIGVNVYGEPCGGNIQLILDRMADIYAMWCYVNSDRYYIDHYDLIELTGDPEYYASNCTLHNFYFCNQPGLRLGQQHTEVINIPLIKGRYAEFYMYLFGETEPEIFYTYHWDVWKEWGLYYDILYGGLTSIVSSSVSAEKMERYMELIDFVYFDFDPIVTKQAYPVWIPPRGEIGKHNVYTLSDPRDKRVFYVGYSSAPYERYKQHIKNQTNPGIRREIDDIFNECGFMPLMDIIYATNDKQDAIEYERAAIAEYSNGFLLANRASY